MLVCLRYLSSIHGEPTRPGAVPGVTATPVNSTTRVSLAASSVQDGTAHAPSAAKKMRTTPSPSPAPADLARDTDHHLGPAVLRAHSQNDVLPVHAVVRPAATPAGAPTISADVLLGSFEAAPRNHPSTFPNDAGTANAPAETPSAPMRVTAAAVLRDEGTGDKACVGVECALAGLGPVGMAAERAVQRVHRGVEEVHRGVEQEPEAGSPLPTGKATPVDPLTSAAEKEKGQVPTREVGAIAHGVTAAAAVRTGEIAAPALFNIAQRQPVGVPQPAPTESPDAPDKTQKSAQVQADETIRTVHMMQARPAIATNAEEGDAGYCADKALVRAAEPSPQRQQTDIGLPHVPNGVATGAADQGRGQNAVAQVLTPRPLTVVLAPHTTDDVTALNAGMAGAADVPCAAVVGALNAGVCGGNHRCNGSSAPAEKLGVQTSRDLGAARRADGRGAVTADERATAADDEPDRETPAAPTKTTTEAEIELGPEIALDGAANSLRPMPATDATTAGDETGSPNVREQATGTECGMVSGHPVAGESATAHEAEVSAASDALASAAGTDAEDVAPVLILPAAGMLVAGGQGNAGRPAVLPDQGLASSSARGPRRIAADAVITERPMGNSEGQRAAEQGEPAEEAALSNEKAPETEEAERPGSRSCSAGSGSECDFERATIPPMLAVRPPIGNERAFVRVPSAAAAPFRHPLAVWDDAPWSDDEEAASTTPPAPIPRAAEEPAPPPEPSPPCGLCPQYDSGDLSPLSMISVRVRRASFGRPGKDVLVHHECAEWAPEVYWTSDDVVVNVDTAYARGRRLRCAACNTKGATIGCQVESCRRTFHYRCLRVARCKVDDTKYAVYCEAHSDVPDEALFRSVTGAWACRVPEY